MMYKDIFDFVLIVLCCIMYGATFYLRVKGNLIQAVGMLIAEVEATGLPGKEKMMQVVDKLYAMVPGPLKHWLTPHKMEEIAQAVFGWMRKYADNYKNAAREEGEAEQRKVLYQANAETTAEIVVELMRMSETTLAEMAANHGVTLYNGITREEMIRGILLDTLQKV